jgi:hypothetical protein
MKVWLRRAAVAATLAALAAAVYTTQKALDRGRPVNFVDQNPVFLPNGKMLRWVSMGYRAAVGDWLWIRAVLYYGRRVMDEDNPYFVYARDRGSLQAELQAIDRRSASRPVPQDSLQRELIHLLYRFENRGLVEYVYPLLDRVHAVDPRFVFPHIFGGIFVLMDTGDLGDAEALLLKGYAANTDSWELPFYLGWFYWMYRSELQTSRRYMLEAVSKKGCPEYVYNLVGGLARRTNTTDITLSYLHVILENTDNPQLRAKVEALIQQLERNR